MAVPAGVQNAPWCRASLRGYTMRLHSGMILRALIIARQNRDAASNRPNWSHSGVSPQELSRPQALPGYWLFLSWLPAGQMYDDARMALQDPHRYVHWFRRLLLAVKSP